MKYGCVSIFPSDPPSNTRFVREVSVSEFLFQITFLPPDDKEAKHASRR